MGKKIRSNSIAFKLGVAFVISMVVQSILLSVLLICGGVIKESKANAYEIFYEKVSGRASNLENEMNNVWINFEHYSEQIRRYFTERDMEAAHTEKSEEQVLKDLAPIVKDALYYTKTTGAYLILDGPEESHSALYFRNADPSRSDEKKVNNYMLAGPWSVAESLNITTSANWSYNLLLDETNQDFYTKPFANAGLSGQTRLLGYWSPPFRVNPQDEEVITYSVPITDKNGNAIGVFGIDIAVSYLYKFLPSSDFQTKDSYGYILGLRTETDGEIEPIVTHGALQSRMLQEGKTLELLPEDEDDGVYQLLNHNSEENIYACVDKMGMYYNNTPFANEEWFLIGLMEESNLLRYPHMIERILASAFWISLIAGFAVAILISKWVTKFTRIIELSEISVGAFEISGRSNKVFMTNQIPKLLNLTREQERSFGRDKRQFQSFLDHICQARTEENNVYFLPAPEGDRWLRITEKNTNGAAHGVVEDVTDEILQTKALKQERDYDGLTKVRNRKAFERAMENYNEQRNPEMKLGFIMCDLNELKQVNDKLGHDKGDEYIRFCTGAISSAFPKQQVFRIGGDEFAVILQDISSEEVAEGLDGLRKKMEEYVVEDLGTGIAAGYAFYNREQDDRLEEVMVRADSEMYAYKKRMKEIPRNKE